MRLTLNRKLELIGYAFLIPFIGYFVIFKIFPFVYSIYLTFTNTNLLTGKDAWVGVQNYVNLFQDPLFYRTLLNTFYFSFPVILGWVVLGLTFGMLLRREIPGMNAFRFFCYVPVVIDWIIVSLVWMFIFEPNFGLANSFLRQIGIPTREFLQSSKEAMPLLIFTALWKGFGYYAIFYLAALLEIPEYLYDAAAIDGAGPFRRFFNIIIPQIAPVSVFVILMAFINAFGFFAPFYLMTKGGPARSTTTVIYRYYEIAFGYMDLGRGSTLAMVFTVFSFVFLLIVKRLLNRMSGASGA